MSHTPGPWRIVGDGIFAGSPDPKTGKYSQDTQVLPFYDCDPKGGTFARHTADATLIAAAPDLLAACRNALDYFLNTRSGIEWRAAGGAEHKELAAAIARAEGRANA